MFWTRKPNKRQLHPDVNYSKGHHHDHDGSIMNKFALQRRSYRFLSSSLPKRRSGELKFSLGELRKTFVKDCDKSRHTLPGAQGGSNVWAWAASYQPVKKRLNEDKYVCERWEINGRWWRFIGVMDGHGGQGITSSYTAHTLPSQIQNALSKLPPSSLSNSAAIPSLLRKTITNFDNSIGEAVQSLCQHPSPSLLSPDSSENIISDNLEILQRAMFGSTLTLALIDEQSKGMWVAGVGDSTVALSYVVDGERKGDRLLEHHVAANPDEYDKVLNDHPGEYVFDGEGYVWGTLAMTRAIGDFPYKFNVEWSKRLFFLTPSSTRSERYIPSLTSSNISPPYVRAEPSISHLSLSPYKDQQPTLLLFSDGIDLLTDGVFRPYHPKTSPLSPAQTVSSLLSDESNSELCKAEDILGHKFQIGWSEDEAEGNKAVEIIGNLLAGTQEDRWWTILNADKFQQRLYVDDTTVVVCDLQDLVK